MIRGVAASALAVCTAWTGVALSSRAEEARPGPTATSTAAEARVAFPPPRKWDCGDEARNKIALAQSSAAKHLRRDGCVVLCSEGFGSMVRNYGTPFELRQGCVLLSDTKLKLSLVPWRILMHC